LCDHDYTVVCQRCCLKFLPLPLKQSFVLKTCDVNDYVMETLPQDIQIIILGYIIPQKYTYVRKIIPDCISGYHTLLNLALVAHIYRDIVKDYFHHLMTESWGRHIHNMPSGWTASKIMTAIESGNTKALRKMINDFPIPFDKRLLNDDIAMWKFVYKYYYPHTHVIVPLEFKIYIRGLHKRCTFKHT
jgi:hypothetical protein